MFSEILTPQEHRPRKQQKPSTMRMRDGRMITLFPNGDTQTILPNGTSLHTTKIDGEGTWVKRPCGTMDYIPPDPLLKEFATEKAKGQVNLLNTRIRNEDKRKSKWQMELNDSILEKMDRGKYIQ